MTTTFVERMAVEIDGEGDALLMLHGLGGSSNTWTPLLPAVSHFRRIRPDLPGSGRSDRVEGPLSLERFVSAAMRALAAAGAERVHVIAHSMGTIVAQHLAALHPRIVRSLALFGPLLAPSDPARANIRARAQKARNEGVEGMQAIADALVQASTSSASKQKRHAAVAFVRESLMRQSADGYARSCEALAEMQPVDTAKLACPTLLVTGDEDAVAPPQAVRHLGDRVAESGAKVEIEVLRGCGHWTPVEMPDECGDLLRRFLARQR
ncbi:MAG TPA: alpha/beta hydrolase [Casimicrobiaceae bacterium]|nr:alpha/beta hydrolase [Casimicrobiaceae bacterium]